MKHIELQCRKIWFAGVHLRDPWCIISGAQNPEAHHVMGRNNWPLAFNMDFGVCLSPYWHRAVEGKEPKITKEEAFDEMIARIIDVDEPRAMKILKRREAPELKITEPNWPVVLKWVKRQYATIEAAKQYTEDLEPDWNRGYNSG